MHKQEVLKVFQKLLHNPWNAKRAGCGAEAGKYGMCRIECILLHYKANILEACWTGSGQATNQRRLSIYGSIFIMAKKAGQSFPTAFCTGNLISVQSTINYKHSLLSTWTFAWKVAVTMARTNSKKQSKKASWRRETALAQISSYLFWGARVLRGLLYSRIFSQLQTWPIALLSTAIHMQLGQACQP